MNTRTRDTRHPRAALGLLAALTVATCLAAGCASEPPQPAPQTPAAVTAPPEPAYTDYFVYEIARGDTLTSLGTRFHVPWQVIARENQMADPNALRPGQVLLMPHAPGVAVPEPTPARSGASSGSPAPRQPVNAADLNRGRPDSRFWWPTHGTLARRYGGDVRGMPEPGIAISAPAGTEVCAAADGTVVTWVHGDESNGAGWGNVMAIDHGDYVTWYAHLDSVLVRKGARVRQGEPIGTVGATGAATSPQLAFRIYRDERPVDPLSLLP